MSRTTVEHVINRFGSQQRVADLLGIWQTAVSGWVRRGAIPARRQQQLLTIAQREGVDLEPADFFGIPSNGLDDAPANHSEVASVMTETAKVIPLTGGASPGRHAGRCRHAGCRSLDDGRPDQPGRPDLAGLRPAGVQRAGC